MPLCHLVGSSILNVLLSCSHVLPLSHSFEKQSIVLDILGVQKLMNLESELEGVSSSDIFFQWFLNAGGKNVTCIPGSVVPSGICGSGLKIKIWESSAMAVDETVRGECAQWTQAECRAQRHWKGNRVPKCVWGDGILSTGKGILSTETEGPETKVAVEVEGMEWGVLASTLRIFLLAKEAPMLQLYHF